MFKSSCLRVLCALFVLVASAISAADGPSQRQDLPGQLFRVGDHRLHLYCAGTGSPTVIFESGLGGLGIEWMDLLQRVALTSRACLYDRAGYGWSEPGPLPRTAGRAADELSALLAAARIDGPLLLVAHSFGGYVAQTYVRRHPERVAGLVLVESSHPAQLASFPVRRGHYCEALARGYPLRMDLRPRLAAGYPAAWRDVSLQLLLADKTARAQLSELCNYAASASDAAGDDAPFPALPLVVISRGRAEFPATPRGDALERAWAALQRELSLLTRGGLQQVARDSGHHAHLDQPDLVVETALSTLLLARHAAPTAGQAQFASDP